uniref:Uncharacterized protein n=1 Tax=Candidatus Kentrum sp. LPFa TaxID=2126335 RepID=A0A450W5I0_9GAMM|nr:MAG: hypothetical protein BECKLPF1236B_GA0070989_103319 [Candidatus Kentron sp. LPFa]
MKYTLALIVFTVQEIIGLVLFLILNHYLGPKDGNTWNWAAIFKGILERLVLYISFIHDYPQIVIALSALKLGTRLHSEQSSEISNAYFLVGTLFSMLLAVISAIVTKALW